MAALAGPACLGGHRPIARRPGHGSRAFTLAFVLAGQGCVPKWGGNRPLRGEIDVTCIAAIRVAGSDVSVSFGGWSSRKLGTRCKMATALVSAHRQVIHAYGLHAIDVDIEHTEFTNATTQWRVTTALLPVRLAHPAVQVSLTFGTAPSGPDAPSVEFVPYAWAIMPFDFGIPEATMGAASVTAAEGLHADLMASSGRDLQDVSAGRFTRPSPCRRKARHPSTTPHRAALLRALVTTGGP